MYIHEKESGAIKNFHIFSYNFVFPYNYTKISLLA